MSVYVILYALILSRYSTTLLHYRFIISRGTSGKFSRFHRNSLEYPALRSTIIML